MNNKSVKTILMAIRIIAAIILLNYGVENVSKPSNLYLYAGLAEIMLAIIILYTPAKTLIRNL